MSVSVLVCRLFAEDQGAQATRQAKCLRFDAASHVQEMRSGGDLMSKLIPSHASQVSAAKTGPAR